MKVRPATPEDLSFIVQAQLEMALETEDLKLDKPTVEKGCRAVLEDSTKGDYWMVEDASGLLGMCLTVPEWSDWRNGTVLWIHSVYTLPQARGRGVFRALYAFLKNKTETSSNIKGLRLYVDKRNKLARGIYEKVGMSADHYELFEWLK